MEAMLTVRRTGRLVASHGLKEAAEPISRLVSLTLTVPGKGS